MPGHGCPQIIKPALHFPDDNGQSFHFLAAE